MRIAFTMAPGKGETDQLLAGLASELARQGLKICGTIQRNNDRASGPCDMDLYVLPGGPTLRISQDLGAASKGCRLDPNALETAVGLAEARLEPEVDLVIINKFGKHEAEGRGFRTIIAAAFELGIPVLVGVNAINLTAFREFVGAEAQQIFPTDAALRQWCQEVLRMGKQVA